MTYLKMCKAGISATALMAAMPALADVTAEDVWANWQESMSLYGEGGLTVAGESRDGDTLTISGVMLSMEDSDAAMSAELGDLTFTENGDGTVSIGMATSYPISITGDDDVTVTMVVEQSGLDLVASGDPEAISYDLSADRYGIVVTEIAGPDGTMDSDIRFVANDVAGAYLIETGDIQNIDYDLTTASVDLLIDVTDPETGDDALISGKVNGLFVDANMQLPADADFENPDNLFVDGFGITAAYGLESGDYIFEIADQGDQVAGTASTGSANVDVSFSAAGVSYDVATQDIAVQVTPGAAMPLPVDISLAQYGIGFEMPLSQTEDPQDVRLAVTLEELSVNDELWMMGDPAGVLPRDPATLRLDISGQARMLFDLLDPEQADAIAMSDMPAELESVTLNELTIDAVGASVAGEGAFTFDNSDLDTFDGLPRPEGEVTVVVNGANALIDKLVQMGIIPQDQAMMSRMMVGMFANATGDDELTSTITINETGNIFANGQQIR